jgi:hypothetical protein
MSEQSNTPKYLTAHDSGKFEGLRYGTPECPSWDLPHVIDSAACGESNFQHSFPVHEMLESSDAPPRRIRYSFCGAGVA